MQPLCRKMVMGAMAVLLIGAGRVWSAPSINLTVQSEPVGAAVALDGSRLEVKTPLRLSIAPGVHEITINKPGFRPSSREIQVYTGAAFVSFQLEPENSPAPRPAALHERSAVPRKALAPVGRVAPSSRTAHPAAPRRPVGAEPVTITYRNGPLPDEKQTWVLLPLDNPFPRASAPPPSAKAEAVSDVPAVTETAEDDGDSVFPLVVRGPDPEIKTLALAEVDDDSKDADDMPPAMAPAPAAPAAKPPVQTAAPAPQEPAPPAPPRAPGELSGDSAAASVSSVEGGAPVSGADWPPSAEDLMYQAAADLPHFPEKFNILLLGLDRRDRRGILATGAPIPDDVLKRKPANSDVISVIQLDFVAHQVRVVNIPRDTKVRIPGHGTRKINAAYAFGREKLARRVIEAFLNVPIHRTVVVDWKGAKEGIALFKGLGLDYNGFTQKELFWHLRKRSFARGDFHRIERQQSFMRYAAGEFLRMYNEARKSQGTVAAVKRSLLDMAIKQGLAAVDTDLTYQEAQMLAYAFRDYNVRDMTLAQVTGRGGLEGGTEEEGGVYFFNAYSHHSFDEIVARAQAANNP